MVSVLWEADAPEDDGPLLLRHIVIAAGRESQRRGLGVIQPLPASLDGNLDHAAERRELPDHQGLVRDGIVELHRLERLVRHRHEEASFLRGPGLHELVPLSVGQREP
jgi:hypothetical protein